MAQSRLFDLSGKAALVTGAGSGIGRAICIALAEHGSNVACADLHEDWAEETAKMLAEFNVKALTIKANVTKPAEVKAMFAWVDREFGKLDTLFNNAGIATKGAKLHEMSLEDWNSVIDVDLTGVFLCMQEGIKLMLRQKKGSIINITSILGLVAIKPEILTTTNYVAAKHGVIGLTKSGAAQYGPYNIRVNAIAPGFIAGTKLAEVEQRTEQQQKEISDDVLRLTPMRRTSDPSELQGTAVYLAADASSFVTGTTFLVDGGWCVW